MAWNSVYLDVLDQLYWAPQYTGMKSIPRSKWVISDSLVSIPRELTNADGPLYRRLRNSQEQKEFLLNQEEILNHVFNIAFAIGPDALIGDVLADAASIDDRGPFQSFGRELGHRYGWGHQENVTQHDGFYVSKRSALAVELKLRARISTDQVAKYAALLAWEELASGPKSNLALLCIVPQQQIEAHWRHCGTPDAKIEEDFVERCARLDMPQRIAALYRDQKDALRSVFARLKLAVISWQDLRDRMSAFRAGLDLARPGDQTLDRLLAGFDAQLSIHVGTGLERSEDRSLPDGEPRLDASPLQRPHP